MAAFTSQVAHAHSAISSLGASPAARAGGGGSATCVQVSAAVRQAPRRTVASPQPRDLTVRTPTHMASSVSVFPSRIPVLPVTTRRRVSRGHCKAQGTRAGREHSSSHEGHEVPARKVPAASSRQNASIPRNPPSTQHQPYGVPEKGAEPDQWDIVGLGQAMVDFSAMIGDEFLEELNLPKGKRVVVDHEERGQVLRALDGCAYKLSAGGSLSNTLVALARLGKAEHSANAGTERAAAAREHVGEESLSDSEDSMPDYASDISGKALTDSSRKQVNVAMVGSVGSDALGDFYRTKLLRANVNFLSPPLQNGTTGTVIVLTTPDAQRSMLSYQGMSSEVSFDAAMKAVVAKSRVLIVEGYLWELPQTVDAIAEACAVARSKGLLVALTASDTSCVLRHRPKFWSVLCRSAHILFCNASEARALAGCSEATSPAALAQHLSQFCPFVSVTDGEAGSYLALRGQVVHIPAQVCIPKDTCGAGDAYAAGVLFGLLKGAPDLESIGSMAARVSAVVVSQQGARLREEDAALLADSPGFPEKNLAEGPVFHTMMGLQPVEEVMAKASS